MIARRTRRMSSSLLPLNITPQITSIHPARPLENDPAENTGAGSDEDLAEDYDAAGHRRREAGVAALRGGRARIRPEIRADVSRRVLRRHDGELPRAEVAPRVETADPHGEPVS